MIHTLIIMKFNIIQINIFLIIHVTVYIRFYCLYKKHHVIQSNIIYIYLHCSKQFKINCLRKNCKKHCILYEIMLNHSNTYLFISTQ